MKHGMRLLNSLLVLLLLILPGKICFSQAETKLNPFTRKLQWVYPSIDSAEDVDGDIVSSENANKFIRINAAGDKITVDTAITNVFTCNTSDCGGLTADTSDILNMTLGVSRLPNSTSLPATCTVGDEYMDTDATSGERFFLCESADIWVVQGGGAFDDSADPIVQNTTTKDVHIGDGAGTLTGKLEIGGDDDQPQLVVEGHSTQTDDIVIIQDDSDNEVLSVSKTGVIAMDNDETIENTTDGKFIFAGVGGSNNEDLIIDVETNSNNIDLSSSTGATELTWTGQFGIGTTASNEELHVIGSICVESSDLNCSGGTEDGTIAGDIFSDQKTHEMAGQILPRLTDARVMYGMMDLKDSVNEQDLTSKNNDCRYELSETSDQDHKGFVWAYDLDGVNEHCNDADDPDHSYTDGSDNDEPFSVCSVVFYTAQADQATIVAKMDAGQFEYWFGVNDNDTVFMSLYDQSASQADITNTTTGTLLNSTWYYLCATYDGSETAAGINIYFNGAIQVQNASSNGSYAGMEDGTSRLRYGLKNANNADQMAGALGFMYMTGEELTANDIWNDWALIRGYYNL